MAVQEQTPYIEYVANGTTKVFPLTFDCEDQDHLIVTINGDEPSMGSWLLIDGSVSFKTAPLSDSKIIFQRNSPFERTSNYSTYNNSFRPEPVNKDFDRIWWKLQEMGLTDWLLSKRLDKEIQDRILADLALKADYIEHDAVLKKYIDSMIALVTGNPSFSGIDAEFVNDGGENQKQINDSRVKVVKSIVDMLAIANPKDGSVAYVTSSQKRYIFSSRQMNAHNGVTVVGGWEMEIQEAYYALWFATAELRQDQSLQLQAGYDYATSKGRPFVVDAHYYVSAVTRTNDGMRNWTALSARSKSHLAFIKGVGVLELLTNSQESNNIIHTHEVDSVMITYPDLRGDRRTHIGATGEWGYLLTIYESSNIYVKQPRTTDAWGDGIYIGKSWGNKTDKVPTNVLIESPFVSRVRRNGISLTSGENVTINEAYIERVGTFDGITGAAPMAGLDVEPESEPSSNKPYLKNCTFHNLTIVDCFFGMNIYVFESSIHVEVRFTGITSIANVSQFCHGGARCKGYVLIDHLHALYTPHSRFLFGWNADSDLLLDISRVTADPRTSVGFGYALLGAYTSKQLGNVSVRNISAKFNVNIDFKAVGLSNFTDSSVFKLDKDALMTMTMTGDEIPKFSRDSSIDAITYHNAWSVSTSKLAQTIWQNPSSDTAGTTQIFIGIADYRKYKIGLDPQTQIIGNGCNISGLKLHINGADATRAHCKTLGGWLEFKNIEGGNTVINSSFGDWLFS